MTVLEQVNEIFRKVLDLPALVIGPATTAKDVPEWDSLTHIELITAIEKQFKFKFTARELRKLQNVGELCDAIAQKQ